MIYGPGKKSMKDPQPILILADIGVGVRWVGRAHVYFFKI